MAGSDIRTGNEESDRRKNHTYYGNGCPNAWGGDGPYYNGSGVSCSTRLVNTYDGEGQDLGTYYSFSAAALNAEDISTDNTDTLDSFCPLGWQLPYGGTGGDYYDKSKSWIYLFDVYGYRTSSGGATKTRTYPISWIKGGYIYFGNASLYNINNNVNIHTATIGSQFESYRYVDWNMTQSIKNDKRYGNNIRCVTRKSNLESSPWHPRSLISIMAFHFLKAHFPSVKIMSNYLKNETKYFIFMELRANFDEAESKYKMENRILMSE